MVYCILVSSYKIKGKRSGSLLRLYASVLVDQMSWLSDVSGKLYEVGNGFYSTGNSYA